MLPPVLPDVALTRPGDRLAIVIATWCEIETLPGLVEVLLRTLPGSRILVVDDNSPDGTGQWVNRQTETGSEIELLHRENREGLGRAALAGIGQVLDWPVDWIATMDADGSHDPSDLGRLLQQARAGQGEIDVVIGSRYTTGGRIEDWPWYRRWTSAIVNRFARLGLGLPARDNSSALRVYRAACLRQLGVETVRSPGHVYLEEILIRLNRQGARFVECPITFRDRVAGQSTVDWRCMLAGCRDLARLFFVRF